MGTSGNGDYGETFVWILLARLGVNLRIEAIGETYKDEQTHPQKKLKQKRKSHKLKFD